MLRQGELATLSAVSASLGSVVSLMPLNSWSYCTEWAESGVASAERKFGKEEHKQLLR